MPRISALRLSRMQLKPINSKLKNLAGSSMSGFNTPKYEAAERIIPGGLDFKEKAYYLLTGKMPQSVLDRWVPNNSDYIAGVDDQIVTVDISGRYVGGIIEGPHDFLLGDGEVGNNLLDDISDGTDTPFDLDDDFDILG